MSTSITQLCIITLYTSTIIVKGQSCEWTVGSNTLDLSCLAGKVLKTSAGGQDYAFSICANSQQCEGRSVMAAQYPQDLQDRCFSLGEFDQTILPQYSDISGGQWKFTYTGDQQDCPGVGREWIPTFICDTTVEFTIGAVTEAPKCDFSVPIRTKYACVGHTYECSDDGLVVGDDGLSTGWIIIIIFVSLFSLYCILGYIYMAKRVNVDKGFSDFRGNIPNKSMWVKFCLLVMAGCVVTKDYVVGLLNKDKGDGLPDSEDSGSRDESDAAGYQLELE